MLSLLRNRACALTDIRGRQLRFSTAFAQLDILDLGHVRDSGRLAVAETAAFPGITVRIAP